MRRVTKTNTMSGKSAKQTKRNVLVNSAPGCSPIDLLMAHLKHTQLEAGIRYSFGDEGDTERIEELQTKLESLCKAFAAQQDQDWWNIKKVRPGYQKQELQVFAWLLGVNPKGTGKKGNKLIGNYQRAIIKLRLSKEDVVKEIKRCRTEHNRLLGIDDERIEDMTNRLTFSDIFHRAQLIMASQCMYEVLQEQEDDASTDGEKAEIIQMATCEGDKLEHLIELHECYKRRSALPNQEWFDLDDLTYDDFSDDCVDEEIGAIARLFEDNSETAQFSLRNGKDVKRLLINKLASVERYVGEIRLQEIYGKHKRQTIEEHASDNEVMDGARQNGTNVTNHDDSSADRTDVEGAEMQGCAGASAGPSTASAEAEQPAAEAGAEPSTAGAEVEQPAAELARSLLLLVRKSSSSAAQLLRQLLQPLTDEERDIVHAAIYGDGPSDEILASSDTDSVQRESMERLQRGTWLNDEVIHYFFLVLSHRDAKLSEEDPSRRRSHFFKSFFISKLLDEVGYKYDNVRTSGFIIPTLKLRIARRSCHFHYAGHREDLLPRVRVDYIHVLVRSRGKKAAAAATSSTSSTS